MENQEDPESCMELALRYDDLNHSKVTKWHELADFARLNELYVILYEQGSSEEKGIGMMREMNGFRETLDLTTATKTC